jgi:hypothetical protein
VASRARAWTLLRHHEEDRGPRSGRCRPRADVAGPRWALTWATHERGMGGQAGPAGWNSAHGQ